MEVGIARLRISPGKEAQNRACPKAGTKTEYILCTTTASKMPHLEKLGNLLGGVLQISIHADHAVSEGHLEPLEDGARETPLVCPDVDAHVEALLLQLLHRLDRAVAAVVVDK